jgi:Ulp1 family protease
VLVISSGLSTLFGSDSSISSFMAGSGDGMKPHESPHKKNKRIKMTSGQSFVQTQISKQLPVKKPIVLSSDSSEDDPIEQLSSLNVLLNVSYKIRLSALSVLEKEVLNLYFH